MFSWCNGEFDTPVSVGTAVGNASINKMVFLKLMFQPASIPVPLGDTVRGGAQQTSTAGLPTNHWPKRLTDVRMDQWEERKYIRAAANPQPAGGKMEARKLLVNNVLTFLQNNII